MYCYTYSIDIYIIFTLIYYNLNSILFWLTCFPFSYFNFSSLESQKIPNFAFVWFTDGQGWQSAKNNLQDTFNVMPHIYNLHDIENGTLFRLFGIDAYGKR